MKNVESYLPYAITGLAILASAGIVNKLLMDVVNEHVAQTITQLLVSLFLFLYFWWKTAHGGSPVRRPTLLGLLKGEEPLWMTFWGLFQIGNNALLLATTLLLSSGGVMPSPQALALPTLALFCFVLVSATSVWKSAEGYEGPMIWKLMARAVVLCIVLYSLTSCIALFNAG